MFLFSKGKQILKEKGFLSLLRWVGLFFPSLLFACIRYNLYERTLGVSADIPRFPCEVNNIPIKSIFVPITLKEFEELAQRGFDFWSHPAAQKYEKGLNRGVIVFRAFAGNEFLFQTGMGIGRRGTYCGCSLPDDGRTVVAGYTETVAKYRQKGIFSYVYSEIYRYLGEQGFSRVLALAQDARVAPNIAWKKLGSKLLYKANLLTFLPGVRSKFRLNIWVINNKRLARLR